MLRIRKEQNEELGKIALKRFEDSMVEHIKEFFPKYYEIHEEPLIRKVILYAVDRAESYDLITERDVCLYINLVFLLGSNFDTDPQLPWAAETLNDETITDSVTRIDTLYDKAMEYLDHVAGVDNEYLGRALLRIREIYGRELTQPPVENLENHVAMRLKEVWPHKYRRAGEQTINSLVRHGIASAKQYNITGQHGLTVYIELMFMLGSGFDKDPQFPWAAKVLNDESMPNRITKVDQLHEETMAFLEKWLA